MAAYLRTDKENMHQNMIYIYLDEISCRKKKKKKKEDPRYKLVVR